MPDWIKAMQKNWPTGAKGRALKGKSALEALQEEIKKKQLKSLEELDDETLALWVAGQAINGMHELGVRRASGETNREQPSSLPSPKRYPGF